MCVEKPGSADLQPWAKEVKQEDERTKVGTQRLHLPAQLSSLSDARPRGSAGTATETLGPMELVQTHWLSHWELFQKNINYQRSD